MERILVVEDNEDLAFGIATALELSGYVPATAADGLEGLKAATGLRPDLIILDLMLPGLDGYRVLKALRQEGIEVPVLILTAKGEEADKVLGFRLGADDYVTKPFGTLELLARVAALLRRTRARAAAPEDGHVERFGGVAIDTSARTVYRAGRQLALTPKEYDLLLALVRRRGAVASRLELLQEVWGHKAAVMTRTVDMHVAELRRKVEPDPSFPRHILTVRKAGYRLAGQPAAADSLTES